MGIFRNLLCRLGVHTWIRFNKPWILQKSPPLRIDDTFRKCLYCDCIQKMLLHWDGIDWIKER